MANQVIVTNTGNVQVALTPPPNVQVQISRAAIGTVSNVPTANFANYAANVTASNQPNITSLGTLSNLSVSGTVTSGNVSTPTVYSQGMQMQGYDYVQMQYSNSVALPVSPYDIGVGSWFYLDAGGAVWQSNTTGALQTVVLGNNGNISATGNITAPYFIGNGSQLTGIVANSVANANYSNFAGTAFNVNVANVTGLGNIATVNLDGNVANLLTGNGTFVAIPTVSANANYANFAGQVVDNTQSNITALGTLSNLSVTGNIQTDNNVTALKYYAATGGDEFSGYGFVGASNSNTAMCMTATDEITFYNNAIETLSLYANNNAKFYANLQANYYFGDGSQLSNINVANANYANFAGQVVDNTQSNITALGTLGNLSVTGTITTGAIDAGNIDISGTTISTLNDLDLQIQANGIHISDTTSASEVDVFANGIYVKTGGDTYNWQFSETGNLVLPGNTFAVNYANGSPVNLDGPVANANYANFAGTAYSVAGANVTGTVANANYSVYSGTASTANSVAGANVSGQVANALLAGTVYTNAQPNITSLGTLTSLSVSGNITGANANLGNLVVANFFSGNGSLLTGINTSIIANGNSNISIPSANGNILISPAGIANAVNIQTTGQMILQPGASAVNGINIQSYGLTTGAHRISSQKFRGTIAVPLSVQPSDETMRLITLGSNGTALQTNSTASIRAVVDASYTANGANIPLGWIIQVNDTNSGVNNQQKTHNFYSNGATVLSGNLNAVGGNYTLTKTVANAVALTLTGDKTANSQFGLEDAQFSVTLSNVNTTTGFSPFRFSQYAPNNNQFGQMFYYRSRGNSFANSAPVVAGDQIMQYNFLVNSNNVSISTGGFTSNVTYNDNAGNVGGDITLNASGTGATGYLNGVINLLANRTISNNFSANNIAVNNSVNGFMKLSSYTAANLTAITGSVGWMAAVTNSTPGGRLAYWDTTNVRWSYVADDSAV